MMATPDKPRACPTCGFTDTRECDGRHDALTCLRHVVGQRDTLTHRAEAAERELAEIHRGVESVALHDARVARDAAVASASLWRERCNKAEARVAAYQREIHRIACGEQVEGDGLCPDGIALAALGTYLADILDAESLPVPVDLMERLSALEGHHLATSLAHLNARAWARAWKRLARHYQSCHLAGHACLRETHRAKGEQIAALRRARDDDAAHRSDLMEQCDALRAKLARAEGVVEAAHHITRCHDMSCTGSPCTCGLDTLISALATYEEG